jgi:hypothetical protein
MDTARRAGRAKKNTVDKEASKKQKTGKSGKKATAATRAVD